MSGRAPILVMLVLACSACTVGAGDGFGTLEDVELSAQLEGGADATTDLGYAVSFREVVVTVDHLVLQDVLDDEGAAPEDGHAHDEEEAPAAAAEPAVVALAGAEVGAALDALGGEAIEVEGFEPSRELPLGAIRRVVVGLEGVRLEAVVDGGGLAEAVTLEVDLPLALDLSADTARPLDRDSKHAVAVAVEVALGPGLLDGVDFAALADGPTLRWEEPAAPGAASFVVALEQSGLHVTFDGEEHADE